MGVWLDKLEYADDAALVDVCCEAASVRVTCFEACAKKHADMVVSRPKTEYMNVGLLQVDKRDIQQEEYDCKEWQHVCGACGRGFDQKHGLAVHEGRWCKQQGRYEVRLRGRESGGRARTARVQVVQGTLGWVG